MGCIHIIFRDRKNRFIMTTLTEKPAMSGAGGPIEEVEECPICVEEYNDTHKEIACGCGYSACIECTKRWLMQSSMDPHCMKCKRGWDRSFQYTHFGKKFINGAYKVHRKTLLLEREKAMLPATMPMVKHAEQTRVLDALKRSLRKVKKNPKVKRYFDLRDKQFPAEVKALNKEHISFSKTILQTQRRLGNKIRLYLFYLIQCEHKSDSTIAAITAHPTLIEDSFKSIRHLIRMKHLFPREEVEIFRKLRKLMVAPADAHNPIKNKLEEWLNAAYLALAESKEKETMYHEQFRTKKAIMDKRHSTATEKLKLVYDDLVKPLQDKIQWGFPCRYGFGQYIAWWPIEAFVPYTRTTERQTTTTQRRKFIKKCPGEDCRGYLSTGYKCGLCDQFTCTQCFEVIGLKKTDPHVCNEDSVESVKLMKAETHPCPKCATPIFKISGCDQMWCTQCHVAFSWKSGHEIGGHVHNPHYFAYLREHGGDVARAPLEVVCGGMPRADQMVQQYQAFVKQATSYGAPTARFLIEDIPNVRHGHRHRIHIARWMVKGTPFHDAARFALHMQDIILPPYREKIRSAVDNADQRVRFLLGDIDEKGLARVVCQRDNVRSKNVEILQILEVLNTVLVENVNLFMQITSPRIAPARRRALGAKAIAREQKRYKLDCSAYYNKKWKEFMNIMQRMDDVRLYANEQLKGTSLYYNMKVPFILSTWEEISWKWISKDTESWINVLFQKSSEKKADLGELKADSPLTQQECEKRAALYAYNRMCARTYRGYTLWHRWRRHLTTLDPGRYFKIVNCCDPRWRPESAKDEITGLSVPGPRWYGRPTTQVRDLSVHPKMMVMEELGKREKVE